MPPAWPPRADCRRHWRSGDRRQARPAAARAGTIADVRIEGIQRIEPETVRSYLLLQPGDAWDAERVDRSLKALFATGLFADVKLTREGNTLVVRVVENPIINRIAFEGNSKISDKDLNAEVQAARRGSCIRAPVCRTMSGASSSCIAGRAASPRPSSPRSSSCRRIGSISFSRSTKDHSTGVRAINFVGNRKFGDVDAARRYRDEGKPLVSVLVDHRTPMIPIASTYDRELLRKFYLSEGYADFRVVSAVAELTPDRDALHSHLHD